jgi:hypothetical protein
VINRIELAPQLIRLDACCAHATLRARHFGRHVGHQRMAAYADNVFGRHSSGVDDVSWNSTGSGLPPALHLADIGVDPRGERLDRCARIRRVGIPLGVHVAAIDKEACRAILLHIGRAEGFGEQA